MSTPDPQPAPAVQPAHLIDLCDRYLGMAGLASYSDLLERIEHLERLAALRHGQVYRLGRLHFAVEQKLRTGAEADVDEALEIASSAVFRTSEYLAETAAAPNPRDLPANVVLFVAQRAEPTGGRL